MDLDTFIVAAYCAIDEELHDLAEQGRWRTRGPRPRLADSEVLTMEVVGEYLGIDTDRGLYAYFRRHYGGLVPGAPSRPPHDVRPAGREPVGGQGAAVAAHRPAGAARVGLRADRQLPAAGLPVRPRPPLPAVPGRGGLRQGHPGPPDLLRVPGPRPPLLARPDRPRAAGAGQRLGAGRRAGPRRGHLRPLLGDRNYHAPRLAEELAGQGVQLLAPFRWASRDPHPERAPLLSRFRYRIDTAFGQLVDRYRAKRVWARDAWHLWSRLLRKLLSHTLAVHFTVQAGIRPCDSPISWPHDKPAHRVK